MRLSDRYAIEERIAVGGMGTVYRALDERLHRRVAVKVLKDHLAGDPRFVERFRREARAVASLTHPNIASLYDYGEDDGSHYIVMELVDGSDLGHVLKTEGALDPERAQRIVEQVCAALAVAHAAGVVHRDIKPANVLLTEDGTAKVTDFGIARAAGDSTLTAAGSILGTAHYLAPEQAAGDPATPQTDVYATGIVLFQMLTGRVPFDADSPVAVATRHVNDEVPAPSTLAAAIPPHLDEIVGTATAKDPRARYGDAAEMRAALGGVVSPPAAAATAEMSAPVARTARLPVVPTRRWGANGVAVALVAGLALVALGLLTFRLLDGSEPRPGRERPAGADAGEADEEPTERPVQVLEVPNVKDMPVDEAVARLAEVDLVAVIVGEEEDAIVFATDPEAGSEALPGATVTLLTSPEEELEEGDEDKSDENSGEGEGDEGGPPPHAENDDKGKGKEKDD